MLNMFACPSNRVEKYTKDLKRLGQKYKRKLSLNSIVLFFYKPTKIEYNTTVRYFEIFISLLHVSITEVVKAGLQLYYK